MSRDFSADRAICDAATDGLDMIDGETDVWTFYIENCEPDLENNVATFKHNKDAVFFIEARDGWPAALAEIERLRAEARERNAVLQAQVAQAEYERDMALYEYEYHMTKAGITP